MAKQDDETGIDAERRKALARLGLGVATVYSAPLITHLNQAQAASPSSGHGPPPPPPPHH